MDTALKAGLDIVLVVGFRGEELERLFAGSGQVRTVRNPNWEDGMLSSMLTGMRQIKSEKFFIVPGDMPYLSSDVYEALLKAPQADVVYPVYRGKRGHPVLIHGRIIPTIYKLSREKESMKEILLDLDYDVVEWQDDSILRDIDTPKDYKRGMSNHPDSTKKR